MFGEPQGISKGRGVALPQGRGIDAGHVVGVRSPLGAEIQHHEGVEAVAQGYTLHALQRRVQMVRPGGGGVNADADEGPAAPGAQQIPVFRVGGRHKQPPAHVIVSLRLLGLLQSR